MNVWGAIAGAVAGPLVQQYAGRQSQQRQDRYNQRYWEQESAFSAKEAAKARDFSAQQAALNRRFQSDEAKTNRLFQARQAATVNQRAADDLQAAGLNRILALGKPSPSPAGSMPAGSAASSAQASSSSKAGSGAPGISSIDVTSALESLQRSKLLAETTRKEAAEADKAEITRIPYSMARDLLGSEGDAAKGMLNRLKNLKQGLNNVWDDTKGFFGNLSDKMREDARKKTEQWKANANKRDGILTIPITRGK